MAWLQLSFVVDANQVDLVSDLLEAFLAQAVTTENAGEDEFYEVAFPGRPDWQKVAVTGLFDAAVEPQPIVDFVHQQIGNQVEIPTQATMLDDQDWERVWLKNFQPIKVGYRLWVCPSWCDPLEPTERNIILDPGLAFGTGTHPTTNMCLAWLAEQDLSEREVLDYGSGSGILAIAALMSGASQADAVDVDPLAVTAAIENAERNGVSDRLSSCLPSELGQTSYSLVIANILAEVIIELRDTLLLHLSSSGTLLLTGILESQVDRVKEAYQGEVDFVVKQQDHWSMLIGQRKQ